MANLPAIIVPRTDDALSFDLIAGMVGAAKEQAVAGFRERAAAILDAAGVLIDARRNTLLSSAAVPEIASKPPVKRRRRKTAVLKKKPRVKRKTRTRKASADAPTQTNQTYAIAKTEAVDVSVERNGIAVSQAKDAESITFSGETMEVKSRQAAFLAALVPGSPLPVDRQHVIRKIWGAHAPTTADQALSMYVGELQGPLASIGLELFSVRGVGIALRPKEGQ